VHRLTPEHITLCRRLGVTQVRTTVYGDSRGAAIPFDVVVGLDNAYHGGLDVLILLNGDQAAWPGLATICARRWLLAAIQVGNECEATIPPDQYVAIWRDVEARVARERPTTRLVTAAVGGADPAQYVRALLAAGCVPHAVAVHAYGPPPAAAIPDRLEAVDAVLLTHPAAIPVWLTEFGIAPKDMRRAWPLDDPANDGARICAEWRAVAESCTELGVQRAYGYCLDAEEGAGYGIAGTPTADWLQRTQGGTV
jgi:hypothetical protein